MVAAFGGRALQGALAFFVGLALVAVMMHSGAQPSELVQITRHARHPFVPARIALAKQLQATREVMALLRKAPGIGSYKPVVKPRHAHKREEMREVTKRFAALEDKTMQAAGAMYRSFKAGNHASAKEAADEAKVRADARALKIVLTRRELIRSVYDFDVNQMKGEQRRAQQLLGIKIRARTMKKASFQPEFAKAFLPEPEQGGEGEVGDEDEEEATPNSRPFLEDEVAGTVNSYNLKAPNNRTEPYMLDSEKGSPFFEKRVWEDELNPTEKAPVHVPVVLTPYFGEGDDLRGKQEQNISDWMRRVDHHPVERLGDEMKAGEAERIRRERFAHVPRDTFPHTGAHEAKLLDGFGEAGQLDPLGVKSFGSDEEMPAEEVAGDRKDMYYGRDERATGEPVGDYLVNGADPTNGVDHLGMMGVKE